MISELQRERVRALLPATMRKYRVDLWLIFTRESSPDPMASEFGAGDVVGRTALLFGWEGGRWRSIGICAGYDTGGLRDSGIYDEVFSYESEGINGALKDCIERFSPKSIAVNTSRDIPVADGLSSGMRQYLQEVLGESICQRFISAELLIASFRSRKLEKEIAILREAAVYTDRIIRAALSSSVIFPGKTTENDIAEFLIHRAEELGAQVPFVSVVAGASRGHARASDRVIQGGDLLRIDFGITYRGYCTDMQRSAYVLTQSEHAAPAAVQQMWTASRRALDEQLRAMKPGVNGKEIDAVARAVLSEAGFDGPLHGTGHCIGFSVHDAGPVLAPDWPNRYGLRVFLELEEGQTLAVEPLVYAYYPPIDGTVHIGLEEDVVVTNSGVDPLHERQDELILLPELN